MCSQNKVTRCFRDRRRSFSFRQRCITKRNTMRQARLYFARADLGASGMKAGCVVRYNSGDCIRHHWAILYPYFDLEQLTRCDESDDIAR